MKNSDYTKVFSGNFIEAQMMVTQLRVIGIKAIVKDEGESARLAGFASAILGQIDIYVHRDEVNNAKTVIDNIIISTKN
mgnify:CR=1 FL=1